MITGTHHTIKHLFQFSSSSSLWRFPQQIVCLHLTQAITRTAHLMTVSLSSYMSCITLTDFSATPDSSCSPTVSVSASYACEDTLQLPLILSILLHQDSGSHNCCSSIVTSLLNDTSFLFLHLLYSSVVTTSPPFLKMLLIPLVSVPQRPSDLTLVKKSTALYYTSPYLPYVIFTNQLSSFHPPDPLLFLIYEGEKDGCPPSSFSFLHS